MKPDMLQQAAQYNLKRRRRKRWQKVVTCLGAAVVFCTTYALILPAITMEHQACQLTEHTHSSNCYTQVVSATETQLVCSTEQLNLHQHTESCYNADGEAVCGWADFVVHRHDTSCYDENGSLRCPLPEVEVHEHSEACYTTPELTEETEAPAQSVLTCGKKEIILHTHTPECFDENEAIICGMTEVKAHAHEESCFQTVEVPVDTDSLTCTLLEMDGHAHSETCYDEAGTLVCMVDEAEGHWHTELCYGTWELTCTWQEHTHDEYCSPDTGEDTGEDTEEDTEEDAGEDTGEDTEAVQTPAADDTEPPAVTDDTPPPTDSRTDASSTDTEPAETPTDTPTEEPTVEPTEEPAETPTEEPTEEPTEVPTETPTEEPAETPAEEPTVVLSEEDQALLDHLIPLIDTLPSADEVEANFLALEEAGDWDGYEAYFTTLRHRGLYCYDLYRRLSPEGQAQVTNLDKLIDLSWMWTTLTLESTDTVNVYSVNSFDWDSFGGAVIAYSSSASTVSNLNIGHSAFLYWYAVVVEKENGAFVVKKIYTEDDGSKASVTVPAGGFILFYHIETLGVTPVVSVGDIAIVSSDFYKTKSAYTGKSYGTVTFSSDAAAKTAKDNSGELTVVPGADTRDFIEINLYNYGSGSTGQNINAPHAANHSLPGFQQNGGTSNIKSFTNTAYFNFGDILTDDPYSVDGTSVTNSSVSPTGINVVKDAANSPISRYSDVMHETLLNGYPALTDQTSLSYLFGGTYGGTSYSRKMNSQSVNGLFQQNATTGAYFFDSRLNFAQFNSGSDTITLYDEIFTPNFIMYPFGNFMPFNDIVTDSKQVSQIDRDYFFELMRHANYMYAQTSDARYSQLAKVLGQCIDLAEEAGWGSSWTAEDLLAHYFANGSELPEPDDDANNYNQISLDRLYSLDYDEKSDFYFGMEIKMNFMQPKNGLTGNDNGDNDAAWTVVNGNYVRSGSPDGIPDYPLTFNFAGDDDVWVYVDDVLLLDLSGIHRHVGGRIDFSKGEVYYYSLNTATGDVDTENPYKTVTFAEILTAAGKSTDVLNSSGTFKDYSTHTFHFYYMERGSGSSVCRMNFNFPVLLENSISVSKELSSDAQNQLAALGNPDFKFQVLKADSSGNKTDTLFIGAGVTYSIYDSGSSLIGTGTTDANGVFTLKAGQRAEFTGITENSGKYYVRELLDTNTFEQYGSVTVDGSSTTTSLNVTVGSDTFTGLDSPIKDVSDGSTVFTFDNRVTFAKLGSLEIGKVLTEYNPLARMTPAFDFEVTLDGTPLPVGTAYTLTDAGGNVTNASVITAGIVTVPAGSTARIGQILAGTVFRVEETAASARGYSVTYTGSSGVTTDGTGATGTIQVNSTVGVTVTNGEEGISLSLPVTKTVTNPDGTVRDYVFTLQRVTGPDDLTAIGEAQSITLNVSDTGTGAFPLVILEKDIEAFPAAFYYLITEIPGDDPNILYDTGQYLVAVVVDSELAATVNAITKDGAAVDSVTFTNSLTGSLSLEKLVEGLPEDTEFSFSIRLEPGTSGLSALPASYSATFFQQDGTVETVTLSVNSDGLINLTGFKHGEKAVIHGIPLGAAWTITENNAEAYRVRWTADGGTTVTQSAVAAGTVNTAVEVTFINASVYILPETGGAGTHLYTAGGPLLITAAALYLLYYKKRRREDAASP